MARKKQNAEAQRCRDMLDAIREVLGMGPLYGPDGADAAILGTQYMSAQMTSSIGSGNRLVVGGDSFPNN